MGQLTLHNMSMAEVHKFSEQVVAKKFSRALANACDIDPSRIKVLGFRPGSVKIIFEVLPPAGEGDHQGDSHPSELVMTDRVPNQLMPGSNFREQSELFLRIQPRKSNKKSRYNYRRLIYVQLFSKKRSQK